jgi:hypothetical protein
VTASRPITWREVVKMRATCSDCLRYVLEGKALMRMWSARGLPSLGSSRPEESEVQRLDTSNPRLSHAETFKE